MEYNELRDIMLDNNDDKKNKNVKRILVLTAIFVIIFLAVLIVMKFLNTSESTDQIVQTDSRLVLPPEPDNTRNLPNATPKKNEVAQVTTPPATPTPPPAQEQPKPETSFEQVPIIPENKNQDSFEDMVKALKEKEDKKQQETPPANPSNIQGVLKQNDSGDHSNKHPEATKPEQKPDVKQPEQKPQISVIKPKEEKPKASKQPKEKAPKETKAKQSKQAPAQSGGEQTHSGSYIQVFAVKHFNENATELKKLKANGYQYRLYRTNVNGNEIIKILVGPYSSAQIKAELAKIKQNVASGAFIVNIK